MREQDPNLELEKFISTPEGTSRFITEIACHITEMSYPSYGEPDFEETSGSEMLNEAEGLEIFLTKLPSVHMVKETCVLFKTKSGKELAFPDADVLKILKQQAYDRYNNPEIPKP